ncbi:hypothetical protein [Chryseobacterium sp. Mn2064]|uniref:hypothetical protein n=1 Tax=Chryseobacterium sp. Mn2064 TaxID=3395263 RepID=UPI003BEB415D
MMKAQISLIHDYIEEIRLDSAREHFEYEHFPFIQNILNGFTMNEQEDCIKEIFSWSEFHLYTIADFLNTTGFQFKGALDSGYVFCTCFAKINNVGFLTYLGQDLEIQLKFCKRDLPFQEIMDNIYIVIANTKDEEWIEHYLQIIENIIH